jgi:serine O-acetyltransferase
MTLTIRQLIKSDLFRYTGKVSFKEFIKSYIKNPYFRFQVYLRLSNTGVSFFAFIFQFLKAGLGKKVNVQLNRNVPIGYGLYIPHGNVVINSQSKIGNNCSFLQFCSIGAIHRQPAATLGDNVYVGPNVNIVGDIFVGNNVVLGAGSVVVKNIADNLVVVGSPGQPIKEVQDINEYCENLFPFEFFDGEKF